MINMPVYKEVAGTILRIERASIHDGEGLRTVVFFKGCPLDCAWCSTPESKNIFLEKGYLAELCRACGRCIDLCPEKAIRFAGSLQQTLTDPVKCRKCLHCVNGCPASANKIYGSIISLTDVMQEISKDEIFYYHSGGGVTLSGGEPLSQAEFASELLKACKALGIHTAMESSLYCNDQALKTALPWLDLLYVDIKHMDPVKHSEWTGEDNRLILDNIRKSDRSVNPLTIVVRIPLVPGFNDSDQNLLATLQFCKGLNRLREIEILPYHRLGSDTYRHLGLEYQCSDLCPPSAERLSERVEFLDRQGSGLKVRAGSGFTSV